MQADMINKKILQIITEICEIQDIVENDSNANTAFISIIDEFGKNKTDWNGCINTAQQIRDRLKHARNKHPVFAKDMREGFGVIESEFIEFEDAIKSGNFKEIQDECLDIIATCVRFYNGEYETGQEHNNADK